jgi:hypothetical protein
MFYFSSRVQGRFSRGSNDLLAFQKILQNQVMDSSTAILELGVSPYPTVREHDWSEGVANAEEPHLL